MPTVDVYNADGKVVSTMELNDSVFGVKVNKDVMHEVVGTAMSFVLHSKVFLLNVLR